MSPIAQSRAASSPPTAASLRATARTDDAPARWAIVAALRNAARFGSSDGWPRDPVYFALAIRADRASELISEHPSVARLEAIELPLGGLVARITHDLHPVSYLRFAAAVVEAGADIERSRVSPRHATVARFAPENDRLFAPGSRHMFECGRIAIAERYTLTLATDCSAFFPSVRTEVLRPSLERVTTPEKARRILTELSALQIHGLPVGGAPQRLLGELVLDTLDRRLLDDRRDFVRQVDDLIVGVDSERDAEDMMRIISDQLGMLGLSPNKLKTKIIANGSRPTSGRTLRRLLEGAQSPDRRDLAVCLRQFTTAPITKLVRFAADTVPLLCKHVDRCMPVMGMWSKVISILIPLLRRPDGALRRCRDLLLRLALPIQKVFLIALLVRLRDREAVPLLEGLASASPSAIVRRHAILGLARLRARCSLRRVLQFPGTDGDRYARLLAAGAMGMELQGHGPLEEILVEAARILGHRGLW